MMISGGEKAKRSKSVINCYNDNLEQKEKVINLHVSSSFRITDTLDFSRNSIVLYNKYQST